MSHGRGWVVQSWTCSSSTGKCVSAGVPCIDHVRTYSHIGFDADILQHYWLGSKHRQPIPLVCRHDYGQQNYVAAAQQLADMQAGGKIRRIGLTNFDVRRTAEMLDAGVPLVSNQVSTCACHSCLGSNFVLGVSHLLGHPRCAWKSLCCSYMSNTCCTVAHFNWLHRFASACCGSCSVIAGCVHIGAVLAAGPAPREWHGGLLSAARHAAAAVRCGRWRPAQRPLPRRQARPVSSSGSGNICWPLDSSALVCRCEVK
jgi:Aldo/keto reductase family